MSAPVSDDVLRELGAQPRAFKSVCQAMLWYVAVVSAKRGQSSSLEGGGVPRSRESIDQGHATLARLSKCMEMYDAENDLDPSPLPQNFGFCKILWERRLTRLVVWYGSESHQQRAADEGKFADLDEFGRYCRETERRLRRRMEARKLLLPRED